MHFSADSVAGFNIDTQSEKKLKKSFSEKSIIILVARAVGFQRPDFHVRAPDWQSPFLRGRHDSLATAMLFRVAGVAHSEHGPDFAWQAQHFWASPF